MRCRSTAGCTHTLEKEGAAGPNSVAEVVHNQAEVSSHTLDVRNFEIHSHAEVAVGRNCAVEPGHNSLAEEDKVVEHNYWNLDTVLGLAHHSLDLQRVEVRTRP